MIKIFFFVVFIIILLSGCTSPFLEKEYLLSFDKNENSSRIIFYEKTYDFTDRINTRVIIRSVIKFGGEIKTLPSVLDISDNSIIQLIDFNARILDKNSVKKTFSKSDLNRYSLSSSTQISSSSLYFIPVDKIIKHGDLVEIAAEYIYKLPQLGINFSEPDNMSMGSEYRCIVKIPSGYSFQQKLIRGFPEPEIITEGNDPVKYFFKTTAKRINYSNNPFSFSNVRQGVLITYPESVDKESFSWKTFGDWYLPLFEENAEPGKKINEAVTALTAGMDNDKEKLEAIFNYCAGKVRYEQVYLPLGEFIPNDCNTVFERGYGDCKDYSALIHAMAKAAGIKTKPALCFRGRAQIEFEDIAVSQFNHVILYYNDGENDYWLDGTNRSGMPGITSSDLINQTALVIDKGNSRLHVIKDSDNNLLKISGSLKSSDNDLTGELLLSFKGQFAADFYYLDFILNNKNLLDYLQDWFEKFLSEKIILKSLIPEKNNGSYDVKVICTFPNSLIRIDSSYYCSPLQIFPSILPVIPPGLEENQICIYPKMNKIELDVSLTGLINSDEVSETPFRINHQWSLDAGPFSDQSRKKFLVNFKDVYQALSKKYKLKIKG